MLAPKVACGCRFKSWSTPLKSFMAITRYGTLNLGVLPRPLAGVHICGVPALFGTIPDLQRLTVGDPG